MANHEIKYPREFNQEIRKYQDNDKAISGLFNAPTSTLLNNDMYLAEKLETIGANLTGHTNNDIHVTVEQKTAWTNKAEKTIATNSSNGIMSKEDKAKIDTVKSNAEENQSAFSNIKVGTATIVANGKSSQLEITPGDNITLTGDNATKKVTLSVPKLGNLPDLQTSNKNNVVAAVNECFTNANNGKSAIAAAIGSPATASNTFTELANEIKEEKKLVALAAGMNGVETNLREQATTISTYTHSHLPNVITTNGGALVTGSGTGVTPASSTLDTIYHSINNLAGVKNTQINNITGERDTWYNNYVAMEADRNNWMNLANSKKSIQIGSATSTADAFMTMNVPPWSLGTCSEVKAVPSSGIGYFKFNANFGAVPALLIVYARSRNDSIGNFANWVVVKQAVCKSMNDPLEYKGNGNTLSNTIVEADGFYMYRDYMTDLSIHWDRVDITNTNGGYVISNKRSWMQQTTVDYIAIF